MQHSHSMINIISDASCNNSYMYFFIITWIVWFSFTQKVNKSAPDQMTFLTALSWNLCILKVLRDTACVSRFALKMDFGAAQVLTALTFAGPSLIFYIAFHIPIIPDITRLTNDPHPAPKPNKGHGNWPSPQVSGQTAGDGATRFPMRYVALAKVLHVVIVFPYLKYVNTAFLKHAVDQWVNANDLQNIFVSMGNTNVQIRWVL